jgi:carbon starvation protein
MFGAGIPAADGRNFRRPGGAHSTTIAPWFTYGGVALAIALIVYGYLSSALPVWLLLAPRGYLSTFVKLGVIVLLAVGIVFLRPELRLPPFTRFIDGTGPIFAGKIFPFAFITIACGAVSGFHSLISSGTTPKMLIKEGHAVSVGYGSMLLESFVAILALIAAASLEPGVYFAVNSPAAAVGANPQATAATITSWGFPVTADQMTLLARDAGERTLFYRTGGAPSLALGMAKIFSSASFFASPSFIAFWYHFAIMFEALFILTTLDSGTRVGRFMLQDLVSQVWPKFGETGWKPGMLLTSAGIVGAWGYFLYQGVLDPNGGVNSLWPLFGISNQLLATVALCVGTTILAKKHGAQYMWITLWAAGMAGHRLLHRRLAEDFLRCARARIPGAGGCIGSWAAYRHHRGTGIQRARGRGYHGSFSRAGGDHPH